MTDILFVFDEEWKMDIAEKILVVPDVETNYNLCAGGKGGFGYVNSRGLNFTLVKNKTISGFRDFTEDQRKEFGRRGGIASRGKKRSYFEVDQMNSPDALEKKKKTFDEIGHQKGSSNSQYGTMWITNGLQSIKISKSCDIPEGYRKGRH